jgi:hypothetical protein
MKSSLHRIHLNNLKSFREPLFDSLKHGLTVFAALLFSLGLLEYIMGIIQGKPTTLFDKLDIATAFVGFVLMFTAKLLEKLHGKG